MPSSTLPLFPSPPRPAPPPREEKPKPPPFERDLALCKANERRILDALRTPGTLADLVRRTGLTNAVLTAHLPFMVDDGAIVQEPICSLPRGQ